MGTLSLCAADSGCPLGMTTHHKCTNSNGKTTGNRTRFQRHCSMTQPIDDKNYLSTTYYMNSIPPSPPTASSPLTSLHVISALPPTSPPRTTPPPMTTTPTTQLKTPPRTTTPTTSPLTPPPPTTTPPNLTLTTSPLLMTPPNTKPRPTKIQKAFTDEISQMTNNFNEHMKLAIHASETRMMQLIQRIHFKVIMQLAILQMEAKANEITECLLDMITSKNNAGTSRKKPNGHFTQWNVHCQPSRQNRKFKRKQPSTLPVPSHKSPQHPATKVSNISIDKWQTQARQFITNWTP